MPISKPGQVCFVSFLYLSKVSPSLCNQMRATEGKRGGRKCIALPHHFWSSQVVLMTAQCSYFWAYMVILWPTELRHNNCVSVTVTLPMYIFKSEPSFLFLCLSGEWRNRGTFCNWEEAELWNVQNHGVGEAWNWRTRLKQATEPAISAQEVEWKINLYCVRCLRFWSLFSIETSKASVMVPSHIRTKRLTVIPKSWK